MTLKLFTQCPPALLAFERWKQTPLPVRCSIAAFWRYNELIVVVLEPNIRDMRVEVELTTLTYMESPLEGHQFSKAGFKMIW